MPPSKVGPPLSPAHTMSVLFHIPFAFSVAVMLPVAMLTAYTIVIKPFELIKMLLENYTTTLMPALSAASVQTTKEENAEAIYKMGRYSNLMSAPLALGAAMLCEPFIRVWVGEEYVQYAWIAQMASLFQLFWQMNNVIFAASFGLGRAKRLTILAWISALTNVSMTIYLIPKMGIAGAVLATMVTGSMTIPLHHLLIFPRIGIKPLRFLKESVLRGQYPTWLAALVLIPALDPIQRCDTWLELIAAAGLIALVFGAVIWKLGLDKSHRDLITSKLKRKLGKAS